MTETAWIGIAGIIGTLLAGLIPAWLQRRSEEKRWYAEFFLTEKVKALTDLLTSTVEYLNVLSYYRTTNPKDEQESIDKLYATYSRFQSACVISTIYIDDPAAITLRNLRDKLVDFHSHIQLRTGKPFDPEFYPPDQIQEEWKLLMNTADELRAKLEHLLYPDVLVKLERGKYR